jgi:hypothetical protein
VNLRTGWCDWNTLEILHFLHVTDGHFCCCSYVTAHWLWFQRENWIAVWRYKHIQRKWMSKTNKMLMRDK